MTKSLTFLGCTSHKLALESKAFCASRRQNLLKFDSSRAFEAQASKFASFILCRVYRHIFDSHLIFTSHIRPLTNLKFLHFCTLSQKRHTKVCDPEIIERNATRSQIIFATRQSIKRNPTKLSSNCVGLGSLGINSTLSLATIQHFVFQSFRVANFSSPFCLLPSQILQEDIQFHFTSPSKPSTKSCSRLLIVLVYEYCVLHMERYKKSNHAHNWCN